MLKLYIFLTIIILSANLTFAQSDTSKKSSDRINVFDRNSSSGGFNTPSSDKPVGRLNAIKVNPFMIANGIFPVYYERELPNQFAAQIGVGVTFKDYSMEFVQDEETFIAPPTGLGFSTSTWKNGLYLTAGGRYYFDDVMDGLYMSADIAYRSNPIDYTYPVYVQNGFLTSTSTVDYSGGYHSVEFKILFGGEYNGLFGSDNLSIEWYCGIGLRDYHIDYLDGPGTSPLVNNEIRPHLYFGYTLAYQFYNK